MSGTESNGAQKARQSAKYIGTLRLLTVNDVYSAGPVAGSGGWAQLSTLLGQYRTPASLFCVNGDFLGGSALAEHFKGENVVQILNELGTDMVVLGNHEFDYGTEELKKRMAESKGTIWLGSNVHEKINETETKRMEGTTDIHQIIVQLDRAPNEEVEVTTYDERPHQHEESPDATTIANGPTSTPTVTRNVTASPSPSADPFPSHTGANIGFFGVCTPHTPHLSWPSPSTTFLPVAPIVEECIAKLKGTIPVQAGDASTAYLPRNNTSSASTSAPAPVASHTLPPSDGIIAITHLSVHEDRKLARTYGSQGLQALLGGHDHDAYAFMEQNTLVFKAGQNAFWLGIVDLRIEVTLTLKPSATPDAPNSTPSPSSFDPSMFDRAVAVYPSWHMYHNRGYRADPHLSNLIAQQARTMDAAQAHENPDELVCTIGQPESLPDGVSELTHELQQQVLMTKTSVVRAGPSSFADLVADAMAHHYAEEGSEGAIINGGFIRGDKVYPLGAQLTIRDIRYELPFPRVCVLLELTGRGIWKALNQMLAPYPSPSGSFPHVSRHMRYEFDASLPAGCDSKLRGVWVGGEPVDMDRTYRIGVTTFMASGGDGISGFVEHGRRIPTDEFKVGDLVLKYLRAQKTFHPNLKPRIKMIQPGSA